MKLISSNPCRICGVFRAVFFSTEACPPSSPRRDTLYQRIILGCRDPKIPIIPVLDQWLQEGREVKQTELNGLVKHLRKYRRYSQALQIKEWMTDKMNFELSSGGMAVKLDLIQKVHGLNKAEEYFNSIPASSRVDSIHGAMLNCYAEKKSLEKAEDLFHKMKELGFVKSALTYNVMLTLYSRTGRHGKFNSLAQEMEDNSIKGDTYTFNIQLNAYASSDVESMEKFLSKLEADSQVTVDCHGYFIAAKGYLKAGFSEKAVNALKKAEEQIETNGSSTDYEHLITLYGAAGRTDEVYRMWNVYKNKGRIYNTGYLSVLGTLLKLEDIDGAEKIFEEWESGTAGFDIRIASTLISAYCKKGHLNKAFACVERVTSKGHRLDAGIWQCLATRCCVDGQIEKAVETMKNAALASELKWKFNRSTFATCLEYLKKEGNVDAARQILGLLRERGSLSNDVFNRLEGFVSSDKEHGAALDAFGI